MLFTTEKLLEIIDLLNKVLRICSTREEVESLKNKLIVEYKRRNEVRVVKEIGTKEPVKGLAKEVFKSMVTTNRGR